MAITGFDYEFFINDLVEYVHGNISGFEEATADEVTAIVDGLYPTLEPGEAAAQQFYTDYGMSLGLSPNEFFVQDEYILAAEAHRDAWVEAKIGANPFLSEAAAIKQYDDLLNANPYQHYLDIGADLGVNPSNAFDESDFIQSVLDYFEIDMTVEDGGRELFIEALGDPLSVYIDIVATSEELLNSFPALPVPEDEQVGVTPPDPTQSFNLSSAATVDEGGTLTVTVTATEAVAEDTTFTYSLAGSGSNAAGAADFSTATSGSVTIPAGDTEGIFTVGIAKADGAEFAEEFTVTLKSGTTVVDTLTAIINDTQTSDAIAPVATAAVVHYNENATATTVLATVAATDAVGVTGFEIVSGDSTTAPNFAIDATGKITFTEAGLTSTYNNADDTGSAASNSVTLGVKAVDAAGNKSEAVNIQLDVDDVDDTPPTIQSAVIVGNTVTVNFGETLDTASGSPTTTDFKVNVSTTGGSTGVNDITAVLVNSTSVTLTLANAAATGQTFKLDYTPGATPLQDKAGNDVVAFTSQAVVSDTVAPVITAGQTKAYVEGTNDDIADIVYTVAATDAASSIASFAIESGNTSGFYAIDNSGNITLTAAGLAGAANDYETTPNSFTLGIKATDAAGNASTQNVVINVTNNTADDAATPLELYFKANTDTQEGKSGNDTFTGDDGTVDPGDVIDGNEGTDTARLFFTAPLAPVESFTSREVEIFEVQATGAAGNVLSTQNFTGYTELWSNNSTSELTYSNINTLPAVFGVRGGDSTSTGGDDVIFSMVNGKTTGTANVELEGAKIFDLRISDQDGIGQFTGMTITATGTDSSYIYGALKSVNDIALTSLKTLTVKGDKALFIGSTLTGVTTINASESSGGFSFTIDDTAGVNVAFTGSTGNDTVKMLTTQGLSSGDVLKGGTGTDNLVVTDADKLVVSNTVNVSEFEILTAAAADTTPYDVDNIINQNPLVGLYVTGTTAGTLTVNNINNGALGNINVSGLISPVLNAKTFVSGGTSDAATINYGSSSAISSTTTPSLTFANLDTLTLTSNQKSGYDILNTIQSLVTSDVESVTLTGNARMTVTTALNTNPTLVDASGMAITTGITGIFWDQRLDNAGGGLLVKGTSLNDTLLGNSAGATSGDTFYAGQGSDITAVDADATLRDSFIYTATSLNSGDVKTGDVDRVYGFSGNNNTTLDTGDDIIDFASGIEGVLKSGGTVFSNAAANIIVTGTALSNTTNITTIAADLADANGAFDGVLDMQVQIDINGDGQYISGTDFAVNLYGLGADTLYYDATNDVFFVGGVGTGTTYGVVAPVVVPTYALTAGAATYNEGSSAVFNLVTTNVTNGTVLNYTISGVTAADVTGGVLTGSVTVNSNAATITTPVLLADTTTEGNENLTLTLTGVTTGGTATTSIIDTSVAAGAFTTYSVDSLGTDSAAATHVASTGAFNYTDNVATRGNVSITGFGADDKITVTGSSSAVYDSAISASGTNVTISYNSGGQLNIITLVGVNTGGAFVNSVAAFNALAVGDLVFA